MSHTFATSQLSRNIHDLLAGRRGFELPIYLCRELGDMSNMIALICSTSPAQEACVASAKELTLMNAQLVEATIRTYLTEIRNRLDKAAGIGRAADACAGAGFHAD
jgi:hypothetical protein